VGNLLVAGLANDNGFSASGHHKLNPLRFLLFTLPLFLEVFEFVDVVRFQVCGLTAEFTFPLHQSGKQFAFCTHNNRERDSVFTVSVGTFAEWSFPTFSNERRLILPFKRYTDVSPLVSVFAVVVIQAVSLAFLPDFVFASQGFSGTFHTSPSNV